MILDVLSTTLVPELEDVNASFGLVWMTRLIANDIFSVFLVHPATYIHGYPTI